MINVYAKILRDHKISITRAVIEVMENIAKADTLEDPHRQSTL